MAEKIFLNQVWFTILIGAVLYITDAFLTYYASYLYHAGAKDILVYEGVYDPQEVHGKPPLRRLLNPIFLIKLGFLCLMILASWMVVERQLNRPEIFLFILGGLYLYLLADILVEFRRVVLFRSAQRGEGIQGKVVYTQRQVWMQTLLEFYGFVVLYLLIFLVVGGWFFLGGVITCLISSRRQRDWVLVKT